MVASPIRFRYTVPLVIFGIGIVLSEKYLRDNGPRTAWIDHEVRQFQSIYKACKCYVTWVRADLAKIDAECLSGHIEDVTPFFGRPGDGQGITCYLGDKKPAFFGTLESYRQLKESEYNRKYRTDWNSLAFVLIFSPFALAFATALASLDFVW